MSAKERVYDFFKASVTPLSVGEACKKLNIPYRERQRLIDLLDALCSEGRLFLSANGTYGTAEQLGLIKGVVTGNERGFGFLTPDNADGAEDFFIPARFMNGALHKDTVLAEPLEATRGEGERSEVRIVQIVTRGYETVVGTFRRDRRAGYLIPDEKKICTDFYIPISQCSHIKNGVKAVAKITSYPYKRSPGAEIIEVLGDEDDFFAEE